LTKPYSRNALFDVIKSKKVRQADIRENQPGLSHTLTAVRESTATNPKLSEISPPSNPDRESLTAGVDVLVAEDNETNAIYFGYVLEQIGVAFQIVENGAAAVEYVRQSPPKLIFMDVSMPVMDGYDATKAIRDIEKKDDRSPTPIYAVTAHALTDDREKCLAVGMDGFITKPAAIKIIEDVLKDYGITGKNKPSDQSVSGTWPEKTLIAKAS
jgi:CheY-like chemotaxis protein